MIVEQKCPKCEGWSDDWEYVDDEHDFYATNVRSKCPHCGYIVNSESEVLERRIPNKTVWDKDRFDANIGIIGPCFNGPWSDL